MIYNTGDGLTIKVKTELNQLNNWLTFQLWRSCEFYVPDAKILIFAKRNFNYDTFNWPVKVGVPLFIQDNVEVSEEENSVILPSYSSAVDVVLPDLGPSDIKENLLTTFVTFEKGFGKFILSNWINSNEVPFRNAVQRFGTGDMNVNERRVLKTMELCGKTFLTLN